MTALPRRRFNTSPDFGQSTAIAGLSFLAGDQERLERFLLATGLDPQDVRRAAADPAFLLSVLDYFVGDEPLLRAFADEQGFSPEEVIRARDSLAGPPPLEST